MQNFKLWEMDCWDGYKKVGTKIGKNGQTVNNCVKEDDFVPHMMYDPKTKKGYKAKTKADHLRMKDMGYVHDLDELGPAAMKRMKAKKAYLAKTMKKYGDASKMGMNPADVNQRRNKPTLKKR
jgi:hypothetical protein